MITLPRQGGAAAIRDQATGRVLRVIAPPLHSTFNWVSAAADGRLFVLADRQEGNTTSLYVVRLGAAGQVTSWRLVPGAGRSNRWIYSLAVSPDGTEVAVGTAPLFPASGPARVAVYGLSSAAAPQTWVAKAGGVLTWAGDTHLAFNWDDATRPAQSGLRILAVPPGPGGTVLTLPGQSRLAVRTHANWAGGQVTADGSTVLIPVAEGSSGAAARIRLGEFSAASGRLLRWIPLTGTEIGATYCGVLWASRTGSRLFHSVRARSAVGQRQQGDPHPAPDDHCERPNGRSAHLRLVSVPLN